MSMQRSLGLADFECLVTSSGVPTTGGRQYLKGRERGARNCQKEHRCLSACRKFRNTQKTTWHIIVFVPILTVIFSCDACVKNIPVCHKRHDA
jgi:hypothetical protein